MEDKRRALCAVGVTVWLVLVEQLGGGAEAEGGAVVKLGVDLDAEFERYI